MHLLEFESIELIRESAAVAHQPAIIWAEGKESAVLLHLVRKAFHPQPPPFSLLYLDRGPTDPALIDYRSRQLAEAGMPLICQPATLTDSGTQMPFSPESIGAYLAQQGIDLVLWALRGDEGRHPAATRIFAALKPDHPQAVTPELRPAPWGLYNTHRHPAEILEVFPLANWTEAEVWLYLYTEGIQIAPLYLAAERPVRRDGAQWLLGDPDQRSTAAEPVEQRWVRVPTLSIWPPVAVESRAETLETLIAEVLPTQLAVAPLPYAESQAQIARGHQHD